MKTLELIPVGFAMKLKNLQSGFFLYKNEVCFKSDHGDYYISNGDAFWGGTDNKSARDELTALQLKLQWNEE